MGANEGAFRDDDVVARDEASLSATIDDEAVLLQPDAGTYYGMNEVATLLWEALEEPATVAQLRSVLLSEFDVGRDVAERDLQAFLADLEDAGLVAVSESEDAP